jgi:hypothetical protein
MRARPYNRRKGGKGERQEGRREGGREGRREGGREERSICVGGRDGQGAREEPKKGTQIERL